MFVRLRWAAFALGVASFAASAMNAADEPCSGRFFGASLLGNLLDLNLTAQELKLLNGREDPKLKRHLEWRLVRAAADARRDVDSRPIWEKSSALGNLTQGVQRATEYVVEHHLDDKVWPSGDESPRKPSENLAVVSRWISKQPQ